MRALLYSFDNDKRISHLRKKSIVEYIIVFEYCMQIERMEFQTRNPIIVCTAITFHARRRGEIFVDFVAKLKYSGWRFRIYAAGLDCSVIAGARLSKSVSRAYVCHCVVGWRRFHVRISSSKLQFVRIPKGSYSYIILVLHTYIQCDSYTYSYVDLVSTCWQILKRYNNYNYCLPMFANFNLCTLVKRSWCRNCKAYTR